MFRRLHDDAGAAVRITVDGREVLAREGESVAAAMLAAGRRLFPHPSAGEADHGGRARVAAEER
jgi:2Fe-2S iron-sulfur cluster binding domain